MRKQTTSTMQTRRRIMWAYIFIAPQVLYFMLASAYPIVMSYVYSFYDWGGLGPLKNFVGFANYTELLRDDLFWNSFYNALIYSGGATFLTVVTAFLLALVLNDVKLKGRSFYRTLYFLPVVTTTAIIGIIMNNIFGIQGYANMVMQSIGLITEPIRFWLDPLLAMVMLILIGSWKHIGIVMIYWLAGLQMIPNDIYESARMDGANYWRVLWHITLPLLKPVAATILLLTVGSTLHVFDLVRTLTNGGPFHKTETIELFIYHYAFATEFGGVRVGYASAAGVWLGMFVLVISLILGWFVMKTGQDSRSKLTGKGTRI